MQNRFLSTLLLALACVFTLAACSQDPASNTSTRAASPPASRMEDPGSHPVAEASSKQLQTLSLGEDSPLTAPGWVRYTFQDGHALLYRNLDGMASYGDAIIATSADMPRYIQDIEDRLAQEQTAKAQTARTGQSLTGQSLGLNPNGCSERGWWCDWSTKEYIWPNKTVYYRIPMAPRDFLGLFPDERDKVLDQIATWNRSNAVVKWLPAVGGQDAVTFRAVNTAEYCGQATIGYQTRKKGVNNNYIAVNRNSAYNCFDENNGTVTHEMGHVVGLFHEQDRCDRDTFVEVVANTPKRCNDEALKSGLFDYNSVMLYPSPDVYSRSGVAPGTYVGAYGFYPNNYLGRNPYLSSSDVNTINGIFNSPYNPY